MSQAAISRKALVILSIAMLLFIVVASAFSIGRCYAFKCALIDLGAFQQALDTLLATGIPKNTISPPYVEQHWFGYHFSPILYLLAPLYAVFPGFHTLQLLQAILVASAAWPIFLTARRFGLGEQVSVMMALLLLINPYVFSGALWDIHEVAVAVPILAWALWAVVAARFKTLCLLCLLLLGVKEHFGISVAGLGLLWGMTHKTWKQASLLILVGVAAFIIIVKLIMPSFSPTGELLITGSTIYADERYGWISQVMSGELPLLPQLQKMAGEWTHYFLYLFVPMLFFPLMSLFWLLPAAADFATNALASSSILRNIQGYHNMTVAVVLVVATAKTLASARNPWRIPAPWIGVASAICFMVTLWLQALLWQAEEFRFAHTQADHEAIQDIRQKLSTYPQAALQGNVGIWFLQDTTAYLFPDAMDKNDIWVLHVEFPPDWRQREEGAVSYTPDPAAVKGTRLALEDINYGITYWNAPWVVMEKGKKDIDARARKEALIVVERMEAAIRAKEEISSK